MVIHDGTAWRPAALSSFPGNDALVDVDAVSSVEAWAGGTSYPQFGRSSTLVARWDGSTWTPEPTPNGNPSSCNNLTGVTATGTVRAVGTYMEPGSSVNRRIVPAQMVQVTDFREGDRRHRADGPPGQSAGAAATISSAPGVPIAPHRDSTSCQPASAT